MTRAHSLSPYNDDHDDHIPLKNNPLYPHKMSSYLRSWFPSALGAPPPPPVPDIAEHEPEPDGGDDDDDADTITIKGPDDDDYDDTPPAFPALNSAQRAASSSSRSNGPPRILSDKAVSLMPPPPIPGLAKRTPGVPTTTSSSLSVPRTPNTLALPTSTTKRPKLSKKVQLAPGHGALDWANLKNSGADLRVRLNNLLPVSHLTICWLWLIGSGCPNEDTAIGSQTAQQTR